MPSFIYTYGPASALSGLLLVLSFPKPDLWPLAFVALVPLLSTIRGLSIRDAFSAGFLCGLVYFFGTQYWLYHSMHYYGSMPLVMSFAAVLLLAMYQALYIGAFAALAGAAHRRGLPYVIAAPVFWSSLEYIRGHALTGFPWSALGYSQYRSLHLIQIADVVGIYGVSFIVAAMGGLLTDLWANGRRRPSSGLLAASAMMAVILMAVLVYGQMRLDEQRGGRDETVSLVQGNIDQGLKWDLAFQDESVRIYETLTRDAVIANSPSLVIWPESAMPFFFGTDHSLTERVLNLARETRTPIFSGVDLLEPSTRPGVRYENTNSAVMISASGELAGRYDKIHLVPFGEYVPMRSVLFFVDRLAAGIGDFKAGTEHTLIRLPDGEEFGTAICYEIIFPELVAGYFKGGRGGFIVNVTNDAWFGTTAGPYQHWAMAVMRAVENRKPVLRAANTGISGLIDSSGRIVAETRLLERTALTVKFRTDTTSTFYSRHGDLVPYICLVLGAGFIIAFFIRGRRATSQRNLPY